MTIKLSLSLPLIMKHISFLELLLFTMIRVVMCNTSEQNSFSQSIRQIIELYQMNMQLDYCHSSYISCLPIKCYQNQNYYFDQFFCFLYCSILYLSVMYNSPCFKSILYPISGLRQAVMFRKFQHIVCRSVWIQETNFDNYII